MRMPRNPVESSQPEMPEWATLTQAEYEARFLPLGIGTPEQTLATMAKIVQDMLEEDQQPPPLVGSQSNGFYWLF